MNKFLKILVLGVMMIGSALQAMQADRFALSPNLIQVEPLIWAARHFDLEEAERLIAQGASVDTRDSVGDTPLMIASFFGFEPLCRLLIENNAELEKKDLSGNTALMNAASRNHEGVCILLLENKAMVDKPNNYGMTPLMMAAANNLPDICNLLIECKAAIDAKHNDSYKTPLHFAAANNHFSMCKFLIDVQLDLVKQNKKAIATFLGIVRKRKKNLPCIMQYDVAKIIAHLAHEACIQRLKPKIISQIKEIQPGVLREREKIRKDLLEYTVLQFASIKK